MKRVLFNILEYFKKILTGAGKGSRAVVDIYRPNTWKSKGWIWRIIIIFISFIAISLGFMIYASGEPKMITTPNAIKKYYGSLDGKKDVGVTVGVPTTIMTIHVLDTLLNKRGGYLNNDIFPASLLLDNIPSWEKGVLKNLRDLSKVYRNNLSTSGSQSSQDKSLIEAETLLANSNDKWALPSSEGKYKNALNSYKDYLKRITDTDAYNAQFYARADNLKKFLTVTSSNLGSYSQFLSASVGRVQKNTSSFGDNKAKQSTEMPVIFFNKTPRTKVDNYFFEARGYCWAVIHELRGLQLDFKDVLKDKNAIAHFEQIIIELEATQGNIKSPFILNGSEFGLLANHSLVMASYISRANASMIDLINLLPEK